MNEIANFSNAAILVKKCPDDICIAFLQRHFRIGYSAAIDLMSQLVQGGIVQDSGANQNVKRYSLIAEK